MRCTGTSRGVGRRLGVTVVFGLVMVCSTAAGASTPPGPGPFDHINLWASGPPVMTCVDGSNRVVYDDAAWTLDPLLRGPSFAPTVLFLDGAGDRPVAPLRFRTSGYPIIWDTVDDGPPLGGTIESIDGRPLAYGPPATSPVPMITCNYSLVGFVDFGSFHITRSLQRQLGLPLAAIGRQVGFSNESDVQFEVRADQFPLTATPRPPAVPWLVPDTPPYPWTPMPQVTCRQGAAVVYRGPADTLGPLVRGFDWAPMGFWIRDDRMVMPHWSRVAIDATWTTVGGAPPRSGTIATDASFAPSGVGPNPFPASQVIDCTWRVRNDSDVEVSRPLATQLGLPPAVVGRVVHVAGSATVHAFVPAWLWPPSR